MTLSIEQALAEPKRSELLQGLMTMGYVIEDMGAEHGEEFAGEFRFFRENPVEFGAPQSSRREAEDDLLQFNVQQLAYLREIAGRATSAERKEAMSLIKLGF